ncbi:MAG TPA: ATP-grasp domain-containing protein [Fimbriimonas sp.]|nr:ATP-grasp domain-containing protein [Fimbriimonas sp.]
MLCSRYTLPYRVLRCAADAGVNVHVLGNEATKGFKHSRYCKKFIQSDVDIDGAFHQEIVDQINEIVREHKIDVVFGSDAEASRSLHTMGSQIQTKIFPGPTLEQFDLLNDKWQFKKLCDNLGILTPRSHHFESKSDLQRAFEAGEIGLPCILKPLSLDASHGVLKADRDNAEAQIEKVYYAPIICQDYIEGLDIGASIYCENGEVMDFIAHKFYGRTYTTLGGHGILEDVSKIAKSLSLNGVYNFDMRLDGKGNVYYLECNPRFFFKMYLSLMAGINFTKHGFFPNGQAPMNVVGEGTSVRMPLALPVVSYKPWVITKRDLQMAGFLLRDPICYLRESLRIEWD